MNPYSRRFSFGHHAAGAAADVDIYTVPTDFVAIVNQLTIVAYTASATASFALKGVGDIEPLVAGPAPWVYRESCRYVFNDGETMRMSLDAHEWSWYVGGFLLQAT